ELQEALSVTPNDPEWHSDRLVTDIRSTIGCCGSTVFVDEEDLSVHLIHQSVLQFLLDSNEQTKASAPWHFSLKEAHVLTGEVAVTYLNYGIFETRISKVVVPQVSATQLTDRIINDTLAPARMARKLALILLKSTPSHTTQGIDADIGRAVADAWSQHRPHQDVEAFHFLQYASRYWLQHTTWIERNSQSFHLWLKVLNNPRFNVLHWAHGQIPEDDIVIDKRTGGAWQIAPTIAWSISHDHMALLQVELTGHRWIRTFTSVMSYLVACQRRKSPPVFTARMAKKLLQFAMLFKADGIVEWLLPMGADAMSNRAHHVLMAIIKFYESKGFKDLRMVVLKMACEVEDACLVHLLLRPLVADYPNRKSSQEWEPMGALMNRVLYNSSGIRMIFNLLQAGFIPPAFSVNNINQLNITWIDMVNQNKFNLIHIFQEALCHSRNRYDDLHQTFREAIIQTCLKGDGVRGSYLLRNCDFLWTRDWLERCLSAAMYGRSPQRRHLVNEILDLDQSVLICPLRCIQLREWKLAGESLRRDSAARRRVQSYVLKTPLLHFCVDAGDREGVEFLLRHTDLGINRFPP
ncbi:hypothetical protein QBC41DRAFT_186107, partial [Cercophora samala]